MSIKCTPVSKCLDKKTLLWGFEMADLIIVFMLLAILNFLFGQTDQKLLLVWLPPHMNDRFCKKIINKKCMRTIELSTSYPRAG